MAHRAECAHQHYSAVTSASPHDPAFYEEQRDKMQCVDADYLQQKSHECIDSRRAPSHLYTDYTQDRATATVTRESDFARFVPNGASPARRSELATRIVAHRNYLAYSSKPLSAGGAIGLAPLSQEPPKTRLQEEVKSDVFFDDDWVCEPDTIFINGEAHRTRQGPERERVLYGLDSPTAALRDVVTSASATRAGIANMARIAKPAQRGAEGPRKSNLRLTSADSRGSKHLRGGTLRQEQGQTSQLSPDSYRDYLSASGRRYRVIRLHEHFLPPLKAGGKGDSALPPAKGARSRESSSKGGERPRSHAPSRRQSEGQRHSRGSKSPSPVRSQRRRETRKSDGSSKNARNRHIDGKQADVAPPHKRAASNQAPRGYRRSMSPSFPALDGHSGSSASASPTDSISSVEGLIAVHSSVRGKGERSDSRRRQRSRAFRRRSRAVRESRAGETAESPLPLPRGGGGGGGGGRAAAHPQPRPPSQRRSHERERHGRRHRRHHNYGRRAPHKNDGRGAAPSDSSEFSSPRSDSAWPVPVSASSSAPGASDLSDCVVTDELRRTRPEPQPNGRTASRRARARGAQSSRTHADEDETDSLSDCSSSSSSYSDAEWEDEDSNSPLSTSSSSSLSSSELSSSSSWQDERRRPRDGRDSRRRTRRGTHMSSSALRRRGTSTGDYATRSRSRRGAGKAHGRRRSDSTTSSSSRSSSSDDARASGAPRSTRAHTRAAAGGEKPSAASAAPLAVHAVVPTNPPGMLPTLMEEVLPSTRYTTSAPSPLTPRRAAPTPVAAHCCVSPAVPAQRTQNGAAEKAESRANAAADPTRRAYDEMPTSPLQATRFRHLSAASVASSGPLCTSPQANDRHGEGPIARSLAVVSSQTSPLRAVGPLDLDHVTEHVLRVIRDRLRGGGGGGVGYSTEDLLSRRREQSESAAAAAAAAERERSARQAEERAAAAAQAAEKVRLRGLLHEAQQEARYVLARQLSLSSLTDSLRLAFAQIMHLTEAEEGGANREPPLGPLDASTSKRGGSPSADGLSGAHTLVYRGAERVAAEALPRTSAGEASAAVGLHGHGATLPGTTVDAATLERLVAALRHRRQRHETEELLQRQQAEEEAVAAAAVAAAKKAQEEAAARQEQERQHRRDVEALLTSERLARAGVREEEEELWDEMLVEMAASLDDAIDRLIAAQREARLSLCERELDERADIAATEEEAAADFWDIAAQLWQAAADEEAARAAEEEERQRLEREAAAATAAWHAAQTAEAERLQAEVRRMEADAAVSRIRQERDRRGKRGGSESFNSDGERIVRSNLIPGQLLGVTGAKIRLVGDPHVAAVEARARERRRSDRVRQQRLASAVQSRPGTDRAGVPSGSRLSSRQPSTVRMGIVGSSVAPAKPRSRASSRGSRASSAYNFPADNNGRIAPRSHSPSQLQSQSNFVVEADVDLQVDGHQAGTPARTRSRASSLSSARGVRMMGGDFSAATPHKNRILGEVPAVNSVRASQFEY